MAKTLTATGVVGKGVRFVGSDPSFGFMPRDAADILKSLQSVSYSESTTSGVTTGTLEFSGLGRVGALRVTDDPSGGRHGIDSLQFLNGRGRVLLSLEGIDQPERYANTRAALSALIDDYADVVEGLYDGANVIRSTNFGDLIRAGGGADTVASGGGRDTVFGEAGSDRIVAGGGNDRLVGGKGADELTGGAGSDRFVFDAVNESGPGSRADTLVDFDARADRIDLRGFDANTGEAGVQAFDFIGSRAFSGEAGELHRVGRLLQGDVDGDGEADFEVRFGDDAVLGGFTQADLLL